MSDLVDHASLQASAGLLIINADDWGGWPTATDAALQSFQSGRITSVSAMVYMKDSERAAEIARSVNLDVGLHVNLNQPFDDPSCPTNVISQQRRTLRYLRANRYAQLVYNPWLANAFHLVFQAQLAEFIRLYGKAPSHIDGHQHLHLCANMIWTGILPKGNKIRRNFTFSPGEKNALNRAYRHWIDRRMARSYQMTDCFFALSQNLNIERFQRLVDLAKKFRVEIMTHPEVSEEQSFLMDPRFCDLCRDVRLESYSKL